MTMKPAFRDAKAFLSNMAVTPFESTLLATKIMSVEHGFQALKTHDESERTKVLQASTPQKAKALGRKVTLRHDWEQCKLQLLETLVREKFSHPPLQAQLLATGDEQLVETNHWHDQFFGDCYCAKHKNSPGANHLGIILMRVRASL